METIEFNHLHVHSEYSLLDGKSSVEELIDKAVELGQKAIAITDHGSTSGLWASQKYAKEKGIKLILGTEFYYERENDGGNGHLVILCKNKKGLENMLKLQKYGYTDNFYRRPRIDFKTLVKHKEGLIVLSACLSSTICRYILEGEMLEALEWARKFQEEFADDFYIEIQPNSIPEQYEVNKSLLSIANKLGIKTVATNDVHYANKEDYYPHEVMLAMQTKKKMSDENRFKFFSYDFWMKSSQEIIETFSGIEREDILLAMESTVEIADKCNAEFIREKRLPTFYKVNNSQSAREILVKELMQGAKDKGLLQDREYMKEVQEEVNVVDEEGYSDYFLVVQDYVRSARERGEAVSDGRGSASGSKISYLLDITRVEPKEHNLLFERFMAKGRSPDIDLDFSKQDAVYRDLQEKYGKDSVAKIITFGTMKARGVTRRVLSTFDFPQREINKIAKMIPFDCEKMVDAYKNSNDLMKVREEHKEIFKVIESLEGKISHESQHAGGVIVYPELYKYLPVKTMGKDRSDLIAAFDMDELEEYGFYKFDILGLTTVDIVSETLDNILLTRGEKLNLYDIDYNDKNVYDMLSSGDLSGVFQLSNQSSAVMEQEPRNFNDLVAINAIIRPGVADFNEYLDRRRGKDWKVHKDREEYMNETYGLMMYQEQFLLDAKTFAGWEVAFSDKNIRKNRDITNDEELKKKFIEDSLSRGYNLEDIEVVWEDIVYSAGGGYNFNKAHSVSYSMLTYQTAYLKHYYPIEFYSALMSNEDSGSEGQAAISQYIREIKDRGINILPPDINISKDSFLPTKDGIMFKINTITNLGDSAMRGIERMLPIKSFDDFLERREKRSINKSAVTNLIKAGCFDFDNTNRAELLWKFDMSQRTNKQKNEDYQCEKYIWNNKVKAEWEKDSIGMYLSSHPMEEYGFKELTSFGNKSDALQGGEVVAIKEVTDKNNNKMAFVEVDTLFGIINVVVFSNTWKNEEYKSELREGNLVLMKGRRDGNSLLLNHVEGL